MKLCGYGKGVVWNKLGGGKYDQILCMKSSKY